MYYFPDPPYFLLVVGLLSALTSGAAFAGTLKQILQKWSSDRSVGTNARLRTGQLLVPFIGISAGVCMFLSSGLEVFGFPAWLSYAVAVPLTLLIGLLVWFQLGSMFALVERKGFDAALDLDSWR
jgi:hypothetical protein